MSTHHRHGRGGLQAPPPPVLTRRSAGRTLRRSRTRSRSPRGRNERFVRTDAGRGERDRRSRERAFRRSRSPFTRTGEDVFRKEHSQPQQINRIIDDALPIIRRILDPEQVKIPRRMDEGVRPIFEREELKEEKRRRFASDEDAEPHGTVSQRPSQQQVIAVIRPTTEPGMYRGSTSKEHGSNYHRTMTRGGVENSPTRSASRSHGSFSYRSTARRSSSPSTRERGIREPQRTSSKRDLADNIRDSDRTPREVREGQEIIHGRDGNGVKERFDRHAPPPRHRSPTRILRNRMSRSRSHTPPPMPPEIRKQLLMERDLRNRLSRRPATTGGNSNYAGKFDNEQEARDHDSGSSFRGHRGGFTRGRGGFRGRDFRSRGVWEHDLYETDGIDAELNSTKS